MRSLAKSTTNSVKNGTSPPPPSSPLLYLNHINTLPSSSNLLYPKEDGRSLTYICKACHHVESAEPSCTFRREYGTNVTETAGVTTDVSNDPTLPRSQTQCPRCREKDAVYFQSQQRGGDTTMKLYYVCLNCNHVFTTV